MSSRLAQFPGFLPAAGRMPEPGKRYFSCLIALLHPFSRGTVHINSSDPLASPTVDPCVLDNNIDLEIMLLGIKYARNLAATDPLNSILKCETIPGPKVQSDEDIRKFIKENIKTVFHPIGTTSLGKVVNENLTVSGVKKLRVVHALVISHARLLIMLFSGRRINHSHTDICSSAGDRLCHS